MSPYVPTEFDPDVNISKENPLKEALRLAAAVATIIVVVYVAIALLLQFALPHIPVEVENKLWSNAFLTGSQTTKIKADPREEYVQGLLDKIPASSKPEGYNFKVHIVKDDELNAFAVPGGNIVVTSALLDKIPHENALVYVLGHELGHFQNRDHLRGIGMGFAGMLVSLMISGDGTSVQSFVNGLSGITMNTFSRHKETSADHWGLKALNETYGHVGGAADFFSTLKKEQNNPKFLEIMSTHPMTEERISMIESEIQSGKYEKKDIKPLPWKKD